MTVLFNFFIALISNLIIILNTLIKKNKVEDFIEVISLVSRYPRKDNLDKEKQLSI